MKKLQSSRINLLLPLILVGAFGFRLWTAAYDLPFIYHPDEPLPVAIAQRMFKTGQYNPDFYHWPPLLIYIHMLCYWPYFWLGRAMGTFTTPQDILPPLQVAMGTTWSPMPTTVLMGRFISLIAGTGTVLCSYLAARKITKNEVAGLLAAGLMAIAPTSVQLDRFIAPDTLATFFIVLVFVYATHILYEDKWRYYLWAAVFTGLAASSKYNAGLILPIIVLAHFLRTNWRDWFSPKLISYGLVTFAAFVLSNPYALLDYPALIEGLSFNATHYATGHAGSEGDTLRWYISYLTTTSGAVWIIACLTVIWGLFQPWRKEILLTAAFPTMYFLFIVRFIVRNGRTILPLTPFLYILAGIGLAYLLRLISHKIKRVRPRTLWQLGWFALLLLSISIPLEFSLRQTLARTQIDSRMTARLWLDANLPSGTAVALESYAPFVNPEKYVVDGYPQMIDQTPQWYVDEGYEYLIFGQAMYGRFYREPERYTAEIEQYEAFFTRFEEVRTFNDGGYEVKIYRIPEGSRP